MKESNDDKNLNEIIISTSTNEENFFDFLKEVNNNYKIIKLVNKSNISKIYQAENIKEKRKVNLKVVEKKKLQDNYDSFIEQLKREEKILKLLRIFKNIINLYQKIETNNYIIFEFEDYGDDLSTFIKEKGPLKKNIILFKDVLKGISHSVRLINILGIMHRDIKPSNIFIRDESEIKLGGFGCSIHIKDNKSEKLGSIFYTAPEIIKNLKYDEKCDLWSIGVSLYEIYFGQLPYGKNVSIEKIKDLIFKEENIYSEKSGYSEIDELFKKLLTVNHYNRINFDKFFLFVNRIIQKIEKEPRIWDITETLPISKVTLNKKIKKKESFINYDKFECLDDKQYDLVLDEDEKIVKKIKNILEKGKLLDIMGIPNGLIDPKEIPKFNNIIYYDENLDFINSVHRDSDYFEKITSGAFILCTNLDSLKLIKAEIINQNEQNKNILFNLVVTGSKCEKIMNYLSSNKDFSKYITNICIYCMRPELYQNLKQKYPKIHDDIYKKRNDVINFINKNNKENILPFQITKLITYEEYKEKYKERHIKVSEFYGDLTIETYQKEISDIKDIINKEAINGELKQKNEKKVIDGFLTFDIKQDLDNIENNFIDEDGLNNNIKEYTRNTIYKDLNKWLLKSKNIYESVAYFTARLMYNLNTYAQNKEMFYNDNNKILYRGIQIPYSNLLPYERARGKIIILSSFTSTTENKEVALKFAERKNSKQLYQEKLLFSVLYVIKNKSEVNWISNGINIQNISQYKKEKEVIFLPFSFYYVEKVVIDLSKYTADIYLETMGKTEIFEENLVKEKELFYDGYENIIRFKN